MILKHHDYLQRLKSRDSVPQSDMAALAKGLPKKLRQHVGAFGPTPKTSLAVFVDLGLSDDEIARYFGVPENCITRLCRIWNIH